MSVHNWLIKKIKWYQKWHQFRYANLIHFVVFLVMSFLDIYLILQLNYVVSAYVIF